MLEAETSYFNILCAFLIWIISYFSSFLWLPLYNFFEDDIFNSMMIGRGRQQYSIGNRRT